MRRKRDLDQLVAEATGLKQRMVSKVSTAWIETLRAVLVEDGSVYIDTLGMLLVQTNDGAPVALTQGGFQRGLRRGKTLVGPHLKVFVRFRKAKILADQLKQRYVPPIGDNEDGQQPGLEGQRRRGNEQARSRRGKRRPGAA